MTAHSLVFPLTSSTGAVAVSTEPQTQKHKCLDDFLLAQKAAGGDMEAFKKIYDFNQCRVFGVSLRMTGNRCLAEDMTQEVFIQVFRKIGNFKGDSALTTWIHRITVNEVLMYLRKRSVKHEHTSETGELPEQIVTGSAQPERMQVVDKIALERAIKELPDGYRNVFVLHDVIGFSHPQMAEILGVTEGTTKSQLHKARLRLQKLLSE